MFSISISDSGICQSVGDIRQQVEGDNHHTGEKGDGLNQRKIPVADGFGQ